MKKEDLVKIIPNPLPNNSRQKLVISSYTIEEENKEYLDQNLHKLSQHYTTLLTLGHVAEYLVQSERASHRHVIGRPMPVDVRPPGAMEQPHSLGDQWHSAGKIG